MNAILITACLLLLLPALYIGGYVLLVKPSTTVYQAWGDGGRAEHFKVSVDANYRYGGVAAKYFFAPVHGIDRWIRPDYWTFDIQFH